MKVRERLWRVLDRLLFFLPGPPDGRAKPSVMPDPAEPGITDAERLARRKLWRMRYTKSGKGGHN